MRFIILVFLLFVSLILFAVHWVAGLGGLLLTYVYYNKGRNNPNASQIIEANENSANKIEPINNKSTGTEIENKKNSSSNNTNSNNSLIRLINTYSKQSFLFITGLVLAALGYVYNPTLYIYANMCFSIMIFIAVANFMFPKAEFGYHKRSQAAKIFAIFIGALIIVNNLPEQSLQTSIKNNAEKAERRERVENYISAIKNNDNEFLYNNFDEGFIISIDYYSSEFKGIDLNQINKYYKSKSYENFKVTKLEEKLNQIPESNYAKRLQLYKSLAKLRADNAEYKNNISLLENKLAEIQAEEDKIRVSQLLEQAKDIPSSNIDSNLDIYKELSTLKPDNKKYKEKYEYYDRKKSNQILKQAEEKAAKENWHVSKSKSAMYDTKNVSLTAIANNNAIGFLTTERPSLTIRCYENKTDIVFSTGLQFDVEYGDYNESTVNYRIDKQGVRTEKWSHATNRRALFANSPISLARKLNKSNKLIIRFTPFSANPQEISFTTTGLNTLLPKVAKQCGWNI